MWLNLKASAFISLLKNVQEPFGALPFVLYPLESTLNTSSGSQLGGYGKNSASSPQFTESDLWAPCSDTHARAAKPHLSPGAVSVPRV